MLHILLLILKVIGILLLVSLALLFLLFLTVSFSPLKYRAEASCRGNPDTLFGYIRFHWLFHLVSGEIIYRNKEAFWRIRVAWKRMGDTEEEAEEERETEPPRDPTTEKAQELQLPRTSPKKNGEPADHSEADHAPAEGHNPKPAEREPADDCSEHKPEEDRNTKPAEHKPEEARKLKTSEPPREPEKKIKMAHPAPGGHRRKRAKKQSFSERAEKFTKRIKYTFHSFCDKIRALKKKKDRITAFIENETHRKAFVRAAGELKRFFLFIRPKRIKFHVEFGCRNPEYTGYILAGISMIYPLVGESAELEPDFERRILKGDASIEGRFRIVFLLIIAWNLFWDKNVRTTYRHIRKFKL